VSKMSARPVSGNRAPAADAHVAGQLAAAAEHHQEIAEERRRYQGSS
jgi:hypothetical protein